MDVSTIRRSEVVQKWLLGLHRRKDAHGRCLWGSNRYIRYPNDNHDCRACTLVPKARVVWNPRIQAIDTSRFSHRNQPLDLAWPWDCRVQSRGNTRDPECWTGATVVLDDKVSAGGQSKL